MTSTERATYRKVIEKFGPVRPFVNIVAAEERHAGALIALFERFGVEPPQDHWQGRVAVFLLDDFVVFATPIITFQAAGQ